MKNQTKFSQKNQTVAQQQALRQTALEFANVEELIRHDAAATPAPPVVEQRLRQSILQEPDHCRSWWKRLFGT